MLIANWLLIRSSSFIFLRLQKRKAHGAPCDGCNVITLINIQTKCLIASLQFGLKFYPLTLIFLLISIADLWFELGDKKAEICSNPSIHRLNLLMFMRREWAAQERRQCGTSNPTSLVTSTLPMSLYERARNNNQCLRKTLSFYAFSPPNNMKFSPCF